MRTTLLTLALVVLTLLQAGCATSFRAAGPKGNGVAAGVGLGAPAAPHEQDNQPQSSSTSAYR